MRDWEGRVRGGGWKSQEYTWREIYIYRPRQVIRGVPCLEIASGWGTLSCCISSEVDHLVLEEIFLASPLFPPAGSLCHRAGWQRHLKSQTGEISFPKARSLGDRCYQAPERKVSRSGCLRFLLSLAEFWDRIYSFWEVLCETTSGSERIQPSVIWGWRERGVWGLPLLASDASESVSPGCGTKCSLREGKWKPTILPFHQLAPIQLEFLRQS